MDVSCGVEVAQIASHEAHYSEFLCGVCHKLVALEALTTDCCHFPCCRRCMDSVVTESFVERQPCLCPGCQADILSTDASPSPDSVKFGRVRIKARHLQQSQPLAYRVLCRVQIKCRNYTPEGCVWAGDYEGYRRHMLTHTTQNRSPTRREKEQNEVRGQRHVRQNELIDGRSDAEKESPFKLVLNMHGQQSPERQERKRIEKLPNACSEGSMAARRDVSSIDHDPPSYEGWHASRTSVGENENGEEIDLLDSHSGLDNDEEGGEIESPQHLEISRKAERLKKQANAKFNKGDLAEAQRLYTQGINVMNSVEARTNVELRLLSDMYSNRAAAYYRSKQFEECINDCECAIQYEPTLEKPWIRKKRALAATGEYDDAHTFLQRAAIEIPESKRVREEFQRCKAEMESFMKAKDLMDANQIKPAWDVLQAMIDKCETASMLSFAAKVAIAVDESTKALQMIRKVLSINPTFVDGLELRGIWYFLSGDTHRGVRLLSEAKSIHTDSRQLKVALLRVERTHAAYEQAKSAIQEGEYRVAIEQFTIAIQASAPLPPLSPLFAVLRTGRAESFLLSQQYLQALKECQEVVTVRREYAPAWVVRSEVLLALGKPEDARNELLLARRTWGADNPTILEGYKRIDFEIRVRKADDDILRLQKELEHGLGKVLHHSKSERRVKNDTGSHRSGAKTKSYSVRNLMPPKEQLTSHHSSDGAIGVSSSEDDKNNQSDATMVETDSTKMKLMVPKPSRSGDPSSRNSQDTSGKRHESSRNRERGNDTSRPTGSSSRKLVSSDTLSPRHLPRMRTERSLSRLKTPECDGRDGDKRLSSGSAGSSRRSSERCLRTESTRLESPRRAKA